MTIALPNSFVQPVHAYEVATSTVVTKTTVTSASDTAEEGTPEARWNDAVALSKKRRAEAESKVCNHALSKSFFTFGSLTMTILIIFERCLY